ncbi:MAG: hypothetical protein P8M18_03185 [Woeseiaceae bacterium]|nr:hypothetical protein [Woeseiaceae bacterium]
MRHRCVLVFIEDPYLITEILRTPDDRFVNFPDYDFCAHYIEIDDMRLHYVDEGPALANVVTEFIETTPKYG